jgi:hypothetical protein
MPHFKKNKILISLALVLLCGCGYRAQGSSGDLSKTLVSIPLIREDEDGVLRNALATAISATGKYRYSSNEAPCELLVHFENAFTDTIGYEWDVNAATGSEVRRLQAAEGRKTVVALVTLIDKKTKENRCNPFKVSAQVNYDFVNSVAKKDLEFQDLLGKDQTTLQYSLGQLDSEEGARGESIRPLYQELAMKIADVLKRIPQIKE